MVVWWKVRAIAMWSDGIALGLEPSGWEREGAVRKRWDSGALT